jgi:hypothetical protein
LATTFVSSLVHTATQQESLRAERRYALLWISVLTLFAVVVHGYHPYAEDGGLYLAGIKRLLDPQMYPHETAFVVEHLRFSLFAPMVALMVRWSGLRVDTALFLLYIASFWLTLFAAWHLAARCYSERMARTGAVALLVTWMTLPIAGTSLMLMDPYVTARNISTPCALLALVGTLDLLLGESAGERKRGLAFGAGSLLVAFLVHPLMAAYALGCVLVLAAAVVFRAFWRWLLIPVVIVAVATAAMLQALSGPENSAYVSVAMTRSYWFLSQWRWYEWIGLAAPLILLSIAAASSREGARIALARAMLAAGIAATAVSLLFARVDAATHLVARLQPLRIFQLIYVVMILLVGAEASRRFLRRDRLRWAATFSLLAGVMLFAERRTFPASAHLELPSNAVVGMEKNPWVRAFLWVRGNTPKDALLALDSDYIEKPSEDAQCFRAIAERSALPDYSKDGGEASITPDLTKDWVAGQAAQTGLSAKTDEERVNALQPLGVDWVVLEKSAVTGFTCDYANEAVKVCRLPGTPSGAIFSSRSQALQPLPERP